MKPFYMAAILGIMAIPAWAGEVQVGEAWARATAPGQDSAAVSMHITSRKQGDVVAVSSPAAQSAEIHSMVHEDGMMKMRRMDKLPLAAGQEVALGDDGNHLMLIGLKKPLVAGESVPLTVTVQFADKRKEKVEIKAEVKPLVESHEHMHHHHH